MDQVGISQSLDFLLRIMVAAACGLVIGYERENRNKEAGIRTHAIVALGAALIMIVSKYGFYDIREYDASRVAAQIVSGIGFLGAGIIFVRKNTVSGLTTAAGLWSTAGVGMAIGSGLYYIGGAATGLIVIMQLVLHQQFVMKKEHKYEHLVVMASSKPDLEDIQNRLASQKIEVNDMEMGITEKMEYKIDAGILLPANCSRMDLTKELMECSNVVYVKISL